MIIINVYCHKSLFFCLHQVFTFVTMVTKRKRKLNYTFFEMWLELLGNKRSGIILSYLDQYLFFHLLDLYIIIIIIIITTFTSSTAFVCGDGNEGSAFSRIDWSDFDLIPMYIHKRFICQQSKHSPLFTNNIWLRTLFLFRSYLPPVC